MKKEAGHWRSLIFLIISILWIFAGCSSGSGSGSGTVGGASTAQPQEQTPPPQTASIRLQSELEQAREVPTEVTAIRLIGFNSQGSAVYEQTADKAEVILFTGVPLSVVSVNIEYLVGNDVAGLASMDVNLVPGEELVLQNIVFEPAESILRRLNLTPQNPSTAAGTSRQFTLTGTRITGEEIELTQSASWTSSNTEIAAVDSEGLATSFKNGTTQITASFGSLSTTTTLTVTPAVPTSLQVTPASAEIPLGAQQLFTAEATFSDQTVQDVSSEALWESSDETTATMTGPLAEAQNSGTTTVIAKFRGLEAQAALEVGVAELRSITVTPASPSLPEGLALELSAVGNYSDNSSRDLTEQVTWSSSAPAVVSVEPDSGSILANSVGQADISAELDGVSGETSVAVTKAIFTSVIVTPVNPSVANGLGLPFTAVAKLSNGETVEVTTQASWSSSQTAVADVGMTTGIAQANGQGQTTITATFGGKSGSTTLSVTDAVLQSLTITPRGKTIPLGLKLAFSATGRFSDGSDRDLTDRVNWSSDNPTVATINSTGSNKGKASGEAVGSATITAALNGVKDSTNLEVSPAELMEITVTPVEASIPDGTEQLFLAVASFTDGSTDDVTAEATWSSDTPDVATIGLNTGVAIGQSPGTTEITANYNGEQDSASLEITQATITALTVTPVNPTIPNGTEEPLTATATFSNGETLEVTDQAHWTSSVTDIATVTTTGTGRGVAEAHSEGSTTIKASYMGYDDSTTLTVSAARLTGLTVTPVEASIPDGTEQLFLAVASFTDGSTDDVTAEATWSSDTPDVATIGLNTGVATGQSPGTTEITAKYNGEQDSASLEITQATITALTVTPVNPTIPKGAEDTLTATATFSNGETLDVTDQADWISSATDVATITTTDTRRGVTAAHSEGSTTIKASYMGYDDSTTLTVTAAQLNGLKIKPANNTLQLYLPYQFTATATFTDGTTKDVTDQTSWSTDDVSIAIIGADSGLFRGVSLGQADIRATYLDQTAVTGAVIVDYPALAKQDFETMPSTPTWHFTGTPSFSEGLSSESSAPSNSPLGFVGSRAWNITNAPEGVTLTFESVQIPARFSGVILSLRLAAMNLEGQTGGPDETDYVSVEFSSDSGSTFDEGLRITGASGGSHWPYNTDGDVRITYFPEINPVFKPAGPSLRLDDGIGTVLVEYYPLFSDQAAVRITAVSNSPKKTWLIDNVMLSPR